MANLAPLLLLGGAAFIVASRAKKKKRKPSEVEIEEELITPAPLPPKKVPKVVSNWEQRQEALKFLADHGICECDPGAIDGKYGGATKGAVMEFQRYAGIDVDGRWGGQTEKAMLTTLRKLEKEGIPAPRPGPIPSNGKEWTPADIIVLDPECKYTLHISDELFKIQRKRAVEYALKGDTTYKDAESIHQEMVEEYAPLCASLGREGVGFVDEEGKPQGVRRWWDVNTNWIYNVLRGYEILPDTLDEDAESYGLL